MSEVKKLDPLTLPLSGLQVIEASAGTGKTWTLAALYVRLVLGHAPGGSNTDRGLYPPQILVMTFTDAATAELRGRIRARLSQAARYFHSGEQPGLEVDDFLRALRAETSFSHDGMTLEGLRGLVAALGGSSRPAGVEPGRQ